MDYEMCMSSEGGTRCAVHGGKYSQLTGRCQTLDVLYDVMAERARQFEKYGTNEDLKDGIGEAWLAPLSMQDAWHVEDVLRWDYEVYEKTRGAVTWMHLVREEVAEAFAELDPLKLRAELLQVAALCVSWVEKLDARPDASN